jgi:multiple sugar transport system substrate-binding protein
MKPSRHSPVRVTRRRVFAGAATGVLSAGLLACARESGAPPPSVGQRDATLQFMYAGEPTVLDTHTAMSELFTRQYPRIKVEQQHTPAQYVDKVYSLAAAGTLPDVFWGGGADMIDFADRKILRALKPLMQRDKLDTADLFPPSLSQYQWKGEQYGLPRDWAARILFYNVDAFKQAGVPRPPTSWKDTSWTWDAFLDAARKLTRQEGGDVSRYGADVQGGFRIWSAWAYNGGGQILDTGKLACRVTDAGTVDGLQFLQDAIHKHRVAIPRDVLQKEGARNVFINGRVAIQEGTYGYLVPYKNIQLFEWDIVYMPVRQKQESRVGGGGVCFMTSPQSKNPDEAWAFLKFLLGFDAQLLMAKMGGGASCLRRVMAHPDVSRQRPPEHFNIFTEAGDHVQIDPQVLRWSQMNAAIDKEMTDLWDGKRGAKDIAAAMCQGIEPYLAEQRH